MAVRAMDIRVQYPEPEKVWALGSSVPVHVSEVTPSYCVQIQLDDGADNVLTFEGQGLQVTYWDSNEQYQFKTNTYVIDEIAL